MGKKFKKHKKKKFNKIKENTILIDKEFWFS